jgi:ech hydrogenase subunit A
MDIYILTLLSIPLLAALLVYIVPFSKAKYIPILALITTSIISIKIFNLNNFDSQLNLKFNYSHLITVLDFILLLFFIKKGWENKDKLILFFNISSLLLLLFLELKIDNSPNFLINIDNISQIMLLFVNIISLFIFIHAIPYMQKHREHFSLKTTSNNNFFCILLLFVAGMNGLIITNHLLHFYFFFEITTLCSYLLIGHDRTQEAVANSLLALRLNSLGGLFFLIGSTGLYFIFPSVDILKIVQKAPVNSLFLLFLAYICLAGMVKSAQLPFQKWLLGAMVAPTPTSALLHSSTMVKAGIYLLLRFSPLFANTFFSTTLALCGGFTFLATALLAIGQDNAKKVLAYSTISNLGLIIACIGINTPASITAALILTFFHAFNKALLFLCIGTIEQKIASRNLEDMRNLYTLMPLTAIITVFGAIAMILPPFGMLLGKWMAIESSAQNILLVLMLALGSAVTVLYWTRWAGLFMGYKLREKIKLESQSLLTRIPLLILLLAVFLLPAYSPWLYQEKIYPFILTYSHIWKNNLYLLLGGSFQNSFGSFPLFPLFSLAILGFFIAHYFLLKAKRKPLEIPYFSGLSIDKSSFGYVNPLGQRVIPKTSNYYLLQVIENSKLALWIDRLSLIFILLFLGGGLR